MQDCAVVPSFSSPTWFYLSHLRVSLLLPFLSLLSLLPLLLFLSYFYFIDSKFRRDNQGIAERISVKRSGAKCFLPHGGLSFKFHNWRKKDYSFIWNNCRNWFFINAIIRSEISSNFTNAPGKTAMPHSPLALNFQIDLPFAFLFDLCYSTKFQWQSFLFSLCSFFALLPLLIWNQNRTHNQKKSKNQKGRCLSKSNVDFKQITKELDHSHLSKKQAPGFTSFRHFISFARTSKST